MREGFEAANFMVVDAANGADGVRKAKELRPSLIILDLSMPVMNGLEAARELTLLMPRVPLLMFTNNAGKVLEKEAYSAGISAVVPKSDCDALQQLVRVAKKLLGRDGAEIPSPP